MRNKFTPWLPLLLATLYSSTAYSQLVLQNTALAREDANWQAGISTSGGSAYQGSDKGAAFISGSFDAQLGPYFRATSLGGLAITSSRKLIDQPNGAGEFAVGASLGLSHGRYESDHKTLKGLGDIDYGARGTLELQARKGVLSAENRLHFNWNDNSVDTTNTFGLRAHYTSPANQLQLSAGPHLTYGTKGYRQKFWGITAVQSANSTVGHTAYSLDHGLINAGAGFEVSYRFADNWLVSGHGTLNVLDKDIYNSPIVNSRSNFTGGLILSYSPKRRR